MKNLKPWTCLKKIRRVLLAVTRLLSRVLAAVNLVLADGDDTNQTSLDRRNAAEANEPDEKRAIEPGSSASTHATE